MATSLDPRTMLPLDYRQDELRRAYENQAAQQRALMNAYGPSIGYAQTAPRPQEPQQNPVLLLLPAP